MIITEFYNTNNNNIFTKPFGVRSLTIIAIGGGGGGSDNIGGNGAMVTATYNNLPLNSFDLNIYIGQGGQAGYSRKGGNGGIGGNRGNGGNGGDEANRYLPNDTLRGGGGGGAVTKIISSENIISIYAGGGGGAGGSSSDGGNGGNAGAYANGDGSNGENGVSVVTDIIRGGGGGTYLSGGSFGHGSGTNTGTYTQLPSTSGSNFSDGGYGGVGEFRAGGGGGGGYTGGGGGGGCGYGGGAGGGAGSSYASSDTVIYSISNNVNYGIGGKAGIPVTYEVPVPTGNDAATDGTSGYVKISYFNPYTVTFNSTNGITNVVIQYSGTALNPPDPVYNGYTFLGWYDAVTGGNEIGLPYTPLADKTLYAQWQGNSVTFNSTNGNMNVTIQYSGTALNIANPTYTGYTFLGWYDAVTGGNQISLPYTPLVDKTLYARWRGNTVTFNSTNGITNVAIQYSGTGLNPPDPIYNGYTFLGWYDAVTGGNEIGLPYTPIVDKTFYAQWQGNSVTFQPNNNNPAHVQTIQYSGTPLNISNPVYNNYTFIGWYDAEQGGNKINLPYTPLFDNGILYAYWVGDKIIFYSNNGTNQSIELTERGKSLNPPTPTYNGYTFLGWHDAATGGNLIDLNTYIFTQASTNLYAQWRGNKVTFQPNNNNPAHVQTIQYSGTPLNPSDPTYNNYTFTGWYDAVTGGNQIGIPYIPLVDNGTLYAHWVGDKIIFYSNNGTPNFTETIERGIILIPAAPTYNGYTFMGWYDAATGGNLIDLNTYIFTEASTNLYAQWRGNTVTFNSTNGITNVVIQYSGTALNPPDPVYNGYTFLGWYNAVTGGNEIGLPYTPLADKTLYAQWQGNSVTFNSTNGNTNVTIQYSGTALNITNPTYTGYTFLGWYDAVTGGNQISLPYTPLVDKTLYARWRGNHVTFNLINGNMNVVIQYSGTALIIPNPTYTGYTFLGWYDAVTGGNEIGLPYIPLVDKTLYAQWRGNSVTFNSTNGITNVAIQYSGTGLNPSDPVYNNYTFTGWYDAVTGGNKINLPYIPLVDNGTLYAHWVGDKIIFYSNNGTPNFTETFERGIILIPTAPTYNGYTFLGWYDAVTGGNEINLNTHIFTEASINLYAQWQGNTVIFQPNNNNPADIRTIQFSGTALNTSNPSFNSYIFEGWYDENGNNINLPYTPLVDNITIYAYWRNYDVTFNPENYRPNIRVEYKRIPLNSPVVKKAGFFFEGWYDENGNKINLSTFVPSSDVIFYAKWTGYTVTFNVRNRISVETVYNGTEFNPGNISKSDFFFEGWNYEEVGETVINLRSFIPYSNTELYAQFFNSCSSTPPDPPNLWSRATLSCVDYDYEQLAMRRKAEVLKYKGNQNPLTKKQQWSRNVNGNGPLGKKVWATQNILGSNPNVFNLPQVGNTLILCPNNDTDNNIYNLSSTLIGNIDEFGRSVSISGDGNTLAISSFEEQTVYVYTKNINNSWSVAATLYEPTIDSFGSSLQLSYDGNTLITGSYIYPLYPIEYGRAYIYEKIASVWTQTFISTGTNTEQRFGKSVSINNDGSVIAVGSQYDNNVTYNGKIEVFERNGSHWNSAAPAYTLIATGLNFEQLSDTGIFLNGNGNFISATTDANKIYVYKKSGLSWSSGNTSQTLTISSDDNVCFDTNANYLCIGTLSGNISYVYKYNTTTNLFEAQQSFNNLDGTSSTVIIISPDGKYIAIGLPNVNSNTGVVYIYKIINNTWILIQKIYGDRINGLFGISLSFDNDGYTLAIGASSYDAEPGKVYIYFRNGTIITNNIKCEPSSSSDVPGNSILCYDPSVPLVNYLPPPRTYLAGGTKWPQSSWKPGDNGFPRGKKGMRMLFQ
jgi:uncharacterized repeat protein (TIGR02543 family)